MRKKTNHDLKKYYQIIQLKLNVLIHFTVCKQMTNVKLNC